LAEGLPVSDVAAEFIPERGKSRATALIDLWTKGKSTVNAKMEYDFWLMTDDSANILATIDVQSPTKDNWRVNKFIAC